MLVAWARDTYGNFFPLRRSTAFKLTFEESVNKRYSLGSCWCSRAFVTELNFVTKYQIVFLKEKFFEFILSIVKVTYFVVLVEKVPCL